MYIHSNDIDMITKLTTTMHNLHTDNRIVNHRRLFLLLPLLNSSTGANSETMYYSVSAALVVCALMVAMDAGARSTRLSGLDQRGGDDEFTGGENQNPPPKRGADVSPSSSHESRYPAPLSERAYRVWEMAQLIPGN